jgi:hypothetical protein
MKLWAALPSPSEVAPQHCRSTLAQEFGGPGADRGFEEACTAELLALGCGSGQCRRMELAQGVPLQAEEADNPL